MFSTHKLRDIWEVTHFLNGGLVGGSVAEGVYGLVGLTLTFTKPGFQVTFAAVNPAPTTRDPHKLMLPDIKAQVEAANPHILVIQAGGRICFVEKVPTNGVAFGAAAEASRAILGFQVSGVIEGRVIKQKMAPNGPRLEDIYQSKDGTHAVLIWEG